MKRNKLSLKLLIITLLITFSNCLVAAIAVTISLSNPSDCNSNDGMITATASGGTAPYTYSWSNGDNTSSVSNLSEDTYYVTVKDQYNTSNVTTVHLRAKAPDNLTVTNLASNSATLNWDVINGASFYYVQWRLLNGTSWVNIASPTVNYQTIGSLIADTMYEWAVRAVCPHLFSNMPFDTFVTPPQCAEPTGLTEIVIAPTVVNIRWDSVTPQQEYLVRYREVGGTWKYVDIVPYSSGAHYSGGEITKQLGCCGGAMLDRLKPCTDYEWQVRSYCDSSHSSVSAFVPSTPRSFTTANPSANAGSDITICPNETVILVASCGGTDYSWSNGGTNDTILVSPSEQTTYILTASSTGCTEIDIDSVTVFMSSVNADFSFDILCYAQDANQFIDLSTTDSGATIVSWDWFFGDTYTNSNTSSLQNPTHFFRADTATTCLKVTDSNGCQDSICKVVGSAPQISAEFSYTPQIINIYDTTYFTDISYEAIPPINSWYWDFGDGQTSALQNPKYLYNSESCDDYFPIILRVGNGYCIDYVYKYVLITCNEKSNKDIKVIKQKANVEITETNWEISITNLSETTQKVNIEVYNLLGKIVYRLNDSTFGNSYQKEITLQDDTKGIYLIKVLLDFEVVLSKKVFKAQ